MSKFKIFQVLDTVFKTTIIFLIAFAWTNFYIDSLWLVFLLSILITIFVNYILRFLFNKRSSKKQSESMQLQQIEMSNISIQLKTDYEKTRYLSTLITGENKKVHKSYISYSKNQKKKILTYYYKTSVLDEYILLNIINDYLSKADEIVILCTSYSDKAKKFATSITNHKIILLNKTETYEHLFSQNISTLQSDLITEKATKITFKDFWQKFSSKNNAKKFFLSGVLLLLVSIIIPYSVYYIVFGSLLMIFALVCFINGKRKTNTTDIF